MMMLFLVRMLIFVILLCFCITIYRQSDTVMISTFQLPTPTPLPSTTTHVFSKEGYYKIRSSAYPGQTLTVSSVSPSSIIVTEGHLRDSTTQIFQLRHVASAFHILHNNQYLTFVPHVVNGHSFVSVRLTPTPQMSFFIISSEDSQRVMIQSASSGELLHISPSPDKKLFYVGAIHDTKPSPIPLTAQFVLEPQPAPIPSPTIL